MTMGSIHRSLISECPGRFVAIIGIITVTGCMPCSHSRVQSGATAPAAATAERKSHSDAKYAAADRLEQRFQSNVDYLASDKLEGRGVGTPGIELASDFIAAEFARIGLKPAGDDSTYFQSFAMTLRRTLSEESRLAFEGTASAPKLGEDFVPLSFSSGEPYSGAVVFGGFGIDAPDKQYSDFAHFDVEGKVALILRGEPPSWADEDGFPSHHAMLRDKIYNAKDRGAVAVLLVNGPPGEGEADELPEFETDNPDDYGIPAFHITRRLANEQLARAGLPSLDELGTRLNAGSFASAALPNVSATGQAVFTKVTADTHNVIGLLRGEGPTADEYIVIGAHYDHLGIRKPMMRRFEKGKLVAETVEPQIHNGADDNASGVSGLIEIARILAQGPRPERSVLFVAFTAEESGLHGSKYFVDKAVVQLEKIVAMLNLDMIGRMPPAAKSVQVFGVDSGKEFREILERNANAVGLTVAPSPDTGGRSDHAPFIRKDIPAMHFFTGHHPDYHKPGDDADKINARDGALVVNLVAGTARDVAAMPARPTYQKVQTQAPGEGKAPTAYKVVMGLAPGYGDDGKPGMAVEAVSPEGPAEIAGLKAGDRIIRIGDKPVKNIYDYMAALRNNKPGDEVSVLVNRDGNEMTFTITLAPAR